MILERPEFSRKMSVEQFTQYYWYKEELKAICKHHELSTQGTKAELESRIIDFLNGKKPTNMRNKNMKVRKNQNSSTITLQTKLIPDGFKFNKQARDFFKDYYQVSKFSFTKDMAAALREAERTGDYNMTVADLLKVYEAGSNVANKKQTAEDKTYEWNQFVTDFNKDSRTKVYKNKMKVAALLWNKVKHQAGPRTYRSELLEKFKDDILPHFYSKKGGLNDDDVSMNRMNR
ncbi:SAP domain-containing protein [Alkalihalobacillus sp. LMS39]|uniref:SAP domain-containing protein n=1 Tax=Alkalihalobacillus sp. LMS39 TaxID=2924032 RepID=UPI001FB37182|nr:SAP domain-containing protein [Alkalihalobacillus sp. LMS39]UOE96421.1 SAP domain-containing protein [Alkalihalobacillus sp. LMS39]